ncbi:hypothetical protein AA14337_3254 [Acetobacter malorum DSM 14337]|uniref:CobQ/CobB/MinD/ParA nucleotide binding domain-containing protein n=1 Tax=Acetobacter malorum DSM 14337 TaxID=1307910 RepID=A0ABQ0Q0J4_9PROT|nr:ParA family protein [Acetobacter malorum]KXV09879.1 hypothetical protein AD930_02315 [Acetobacter malorum]GBQ86154.1 hypothetical protein AA14337_3254 [Acetobacter malorum DSM 14337]
MNAKRTKKKPVHELQVPEHRAPIVVLVSSGKGGSGKTTLARNLLSCARAAGLEVVGLDLDEQLSLRTWSDIRDQTLLKLSPEAQTKLRDIPVEAVDYGRGVAALERLRELDVDIIVVDTPSGYQVGDAKGILPTLIGRSDIILVPCKQSATDTRAVVSWYKELLHESPKASMVLMGVRRKSRSCDMANNMLAETGDVCPVIIRDLEIYRTTDQIGLGVNESDSSSARERDPDFESLWRWVYRKGQVMSRKRESV